MTTHTHTTDQGITCCGPATLERRKGVYLLHLKGSFEDMGFQHGALALNATGDVVLNYFNQVIESLIAHSVPAAARPGGALLKSVFHALNKSRLGPMLGDHVRGFARAVGKPPAVVEKIALVPDILHYLIGVTFPPLAMAPGCSGFMVRGAATAGGKLLVGRNFDFFGQGVWDAANALIVMDPDHGQKVCWVGALGVPASAQGFNESGIIISLHTKFNRDVRLTGAPLFTLCSRVLAECDSVDQAIALIGAQPRICGLTMFLTDTKTGDAAACGFSANHMEVIRPENDVLVRCNHYITDDMKRHEIAPHPWVLHSTARYQRIHHLISESYGALEPADIPRILGDRIDPWEGRECVAGNIVSATNNSQSVAYSPDDDALWLANGPFPVCRSPLFHGFRVSALFARDRDAYDIGDLPGPKALSPAEKTAEYNYQQACTMHLDHHNDDAAVFHLLQAAEAQPDEPVFPRLAGILLMKQKRFAQALPLLERNIALTRGTPLMRAEALVWAGRCLDMMGEHARAVPHYRAAADLDAPPVSPAARRHIDYPCTTKALADMSPEFTVGTATARY